jgi:hypothetical protein
MKAKIIFFFAVLLLVSSCNDNESPTLELHTPQQVDNTIVLNWEQTTVSGFEYYVVMRASDRQNYTVINDISTPTSDAFHKEITVFEDRTYPLTVDTLYYKIMAIGDETVLSRNICYAVENPAKLLKGDFFDMYYLEETDQISVLSYNYGYGDRYKLKVFDVKTGQFSPNEASIYSLNSGRYFWGKYNGITEFYNYDYNMTLLSVYDASTAQQITTLQVPGYSWYGAAYATNNRGEIYMFNYDNLYIIDRTTGTQTSYLSINSFDSDKLYYNSKDNKLYAVSYNRILTFNLDEASQVVGEDIYQLDNGYSTPLYIENSSLFVVETSSGIKILDMNTKTYHNTELTQMPRIALLKNNIIYATDNSSRGIISIGDNYYPQPTINLLSADNFKRIKTIPVRVTPAKMVANNEYLYLLGQYGYELYLLEKIKL